MADLNTPSGDLDQNNDTPTWLIDSTPEQQDAVANSAESANNLRVENNANAVQEERELEAATPAALEQADTPHPTPREKYNSFKDDLKAAKDQDEIDTIMEKAKEELKDSPDLLAKLEEKKWGALKDISKKAMETALKNIPVLGKQLWFLVPLLWLLWIKADGDFVKAIAGLWDWLKEGQDNRYIAAFKKKLGDTKLPLGLDLENAEFIESLIVAKDYMKNKIKWVKWSVDDLLYIITGDTEKNEAEMAPQLVAMKNKLSDTSTVKNSKDFINNLEDPESLAKVEETSTETSA